MTKKISRKTLSALKRVIKAQGFEATANMLRIRSSSIYRYLRGNRPLTAIERSIFELEKNIKK